MFPLKPPTFGKGTFVVQQKVLFYFVLGLFVTAFVSCNSSSSTDTKAVKDTPAAAVREPLQQQSLFENLHVLYIESDVLKPVLDKLHGNKDRLILEYFRDQNDVLKLITWNGIYNSHRDSVDFSDKLITGVSPQTATFDLKGKSIIMGIIEIGGTNKNSNLTILKDAINSGHYKYILFEPNIEEDGTDALLIKYRIWGSDTTSIDSSGTKNNNFTSSTSILLSPNPSPPATAY